MYLTRLIVVPIALLAIDVPIAVSAVRAWRARYEFFGRVVVAAAITILGLYWATRPGLPGIVEYGHNTYFIGESIQGPIGPGDLGCPGVAWTLDRMGPAKRVGFVAPIWNEDGVPATRVVRGGLFHGGAILQPLSQVGKEDVMNFLLIQRGGCLYQAWEPP